MKFTVENLPDLYLHIYETEFGRRRGMIGFLHFGPCPETPKTNQLPVLCIHGHVAQTTCSESDIFLDAVGRKWVLARALRKAGLSRNERKAVWRAYLKKFPPLPRNQRQHEDLTKDRAA